MEIYYRDLRSVLLSTAILMYLSIHHGSVIDSFMMSSSSLSSHLKLLEAKKICLGHPTHLISTIFHWLAIGSRTSFLAELA